MKNIFDAKTKWNLNQIPYQMIKCNLEYGRNKRSTKSIPINVSPNEDGTLPENNFIVLQDEKGIIRIKSGVDETNRVLFFVGEDGGFHGDVSIHQSTNALIIMKCFAGNACDSRMEVACIMRPNEQVAFWVTGRRHNNIIVYTFNGDTINRINYEKSEWEAINPAVQETTL